MENKENKKRKWEWDLHEILNPIFSEEEIKKSINKKLAYIIVELEHNPISYINTEKLMSKHCDKKISAV